MSATDFATEVVERGLRAAVKRTRDKVAGRLARTEAIQVEHRRAGRGIEAAACAVRAQALQEALADLDGEVADALHAFVRSGAYTVLRQALRPTP